MVRHLVTVERLSGIFRRGCAHGEVVAHLEDVNYSNFGVQAFGSGGSGV